MTTWSPMGSRQPKQRELTEFISKSLQHTIYPAEVHELLSPKDNGWHGPAKANGKLCVRKGTLVKKMVLKVHLCF